jgi:hypothetical protein
LEEQVAGWSDIQTFMRSTYRLQDDDPDMMSVVWAYDDGRTQRVFVRRYKADDRSMVEVKSPFARSGDVSAEVLLRENAQMTLATIAQSGDVYLAIYNVLLDAISVDDFDFVLKRVASTADALEEKYASRDEF